MSNRNNWRRNSGMTILEVLIVLAVIAMIAAVAGPRVLGYLGKAKSETASIQVGRLEESLKLFYIDMGRFPTASEGLSALVSAPAGVSEWSGPYISDENALSDPWGREYHYLGAANGENPTVYSLGRDGKKGGDGEDEDIGLPLD